MVPVPVLRKRIGFQAVFKRSKPVAKRFHLCWRVEGKVGGAPATVLYYG